MANCDSYRFQSRTGTTAEIFPVASANRKLSGSRPEWRLATTGARVFAAAIASSLVAKTQISFSTGMAPRSQSIENKAGLPRRRIADAPERARFAHSDFGRDSSQVVLYPSLSVGSCWKSARNANAIMEIPPASASKSVSAVMKVFIAGLSLKITRPGRESAASVMTVAIWAWQQSGSVNWLPLRRRRTELSFLPCHAAVRGFSRPSSLDTSAPAAGSPIR
jgi:hypothetical protein